MFGNPQVCSTFIPVTLFTDPWIQMTVDAIDKQVADKDCYCNDKQDPLD